MTVIIQILTCLALYFMYGVLVSAFVWGMTFTHRKRQASLRQPGRGFRRKDFLLIIPFWPFMMFIICWATIQNVWRLSRHGE